MDTTLNDAALRAQLATLRAEGWSMYERFTEGALDRPFHPFVTADYEEVGEALWPMRHQGLRFLEWGSATGVITVMADLMGCDACGIELDSALHAQAVALASRFSSTARFAHGSFLPTGYQWRARDGDTRTGTIGEGPSGYLQLGRALDDFDVVFGYPWDGEAAMMLDLMQQYGRSDALLLIGSAADGITRYRGGRRETAR